MNRDLWMRRGAALAAVLCLALAVASLVRIVGSLSAIGEAEKAMPPPPAATITSARWAAPKPMMRLSPGDPRPQVQEYLTRQLGGLGYELGQVSIASRRPLGGGLSLVEVQLGAKADPGAVDALAQWVAVNRDSVRLQSMTLGLDAEGQGVSSAVLLMVVA